LWQDAGVELIFENAKVAQQPTLPGNKNGSAASESGSGLPLQDAGALAVHVK